MNQRPSVLVIDDDQGVVDWLVDSLGEEGFFVQGEASASRALALLDVRDFDLIVSDVEMPEMRGVELLRAVRAVRPGQAVLLITAFGSIDLAVEAVRAGAVDFIAKPFRIEVLVLALQRALRERQLRREVVRLRQVASRVPATGLIADSPAMKKVLEVSTRAAKSQLPVLITGESGVGKGALARFIHEASPRAQKPFVQLNCAALPASLAESELFGVRRGAFTDAREDRAGVFEQANGGSLFLDEIGDLPLELQPKLLQALESNRVRPLGAKNDVPADVRIVAATNAPLEEAVVSQRFRSDLFHRLNVMRIEIPPLRHRVEDIGPIVDRALDAIARRAAAPPLGISEAALRRLSAHDWPGNVRELINAIERASALSDSEILGIADFDDLGRAMAEQAFVERALDEELSLEELERRYIARVLERTGGHKANAARILGLDRRTLYRKAAALKGGLRGDEDDDDAT